MTEFKGGPFKGSKPSEAEGRHDPKTIGEIPGYPVGSTFANRRRLSDTGVHALLRGGIHGNKIDGAYSVVLSYGYEDDQDDGETFIYTGQGGRDSDSSILDKMQGKESWNSHQARDQEWKFGNMALLISCKRRKPVRVIRGAPRKNQERFKYAPSSGLRYDGLYVVLDAWKDEGATGFKTCKFRFQRLPHQLPLPVESGHHIAGSREPLKFTSPHQVISTSRLVEPLKVYKPPRVPQAPRPAYRPSQADIAKLRGKSDSSTSELGNTSRLKRKLSSLELKSTSPGPPDAKVVVNSEDPESPVEARPPNRPWETVRGKQKLPSLPSFKKVKTS